MQLSLEQLEAFLTTVETGSFSGAARKLGKAQSSISGLISNLEIDTDCELFDRTSRKPELTSAGYALLNDVKAVLRAHNNLVNRISNIDDMVESEISIAFDDMVFPRQYMMSIATEFEKTFPTTSLMLITAAHKQPYRLIRDHKVDLAIATSIDDYPAEFAFRGISHAHYCTVVSSEHPLAKINSVSPQILSNYRHLRITDDESLFRRHDSELSTKIWYCNNADLMIEMLIRGFGWAQVPINIVSKLLKSGRLVRLNTNHQSVTYPHCVDMVWHSNDAKGRCLNWLQEQLTHQGKHISEGFE